MRFQKSWIVCSSVVVLVMTSLAMASGNPIEYARKVFRQTNSKQQVALMPQATEWRFKPGLVYDITEGSTTDWKHGYSTVFVGTKLPDASPREFSHHLSRHVQNVSDALSKRGMDGYLVIAGPDFEIAIQHWESADAAKTAFESGIGKRVAADANSFMHLETFVDAREFEHAIDFADSVTSAEY